MLSKKKEKKGEKQKHSTFKSWPPQKCLQKSHLGLTPVSKKVPSSNLSLCGPKRKEKKRTRKRTKASTVAMKDNQKKENR